MRNFEPNEISVFNVAGKPFPFRKQLPKFNTARYDLIKTGIKKSSKKSFAIDDSQYLMCFESFDKAKESGYGKFTDIAIHFKDLISFVINDLQEDVIVYFLHHIDTTETGKIKAKTIGKMLDTQLTVEGLFSIVLLTSNDGTNHKFVTQSDGYSTAKSPMEMFDLEIDNDLKFVDQKIREYYGLDNKKQEENNNEKH